MWFFRAIESTEGWICRHGSVTYDRHPRLQDALDHLRDIAADTTPARVFAHYLDGTVVLVATLD